MQLDIVDSIDAHRRVERVAQSTGGARDASIQRKFEEFHRDNPQVYDRLVHLTRGLVMRGHQRVGMKMLWEVVRWDSMLSTNGVPWKLNNNFSSRYARLIEEREPDLHGVFEKRELLSA